jgi:cell division protein DivIC
MATVLISFIGVGTPTDTDTKSKSGYRTAKYIFPKENDFASQKLESSIFGSVLLKRLQNMKRDVSRWLILGTEQSIWNDLIEVFPETEQDDNLLKLWDEVTNVVPIRGKYKPKIPISQELLEKWQTKLSEKLVTTQITCRLVGECMTQESQENVFKALLEVVKKEDKIVLDITHGLRHQPALASFMVMFLRWFNDNQVEIYSGVLELNAQVVKLDLCSNLLESTAALATFKNTGNYSPLGKSLNLSDDFAEQIATLRFADEVNRSDRKTPEKLHRALADETLNTFQNSLQPILKEALSWTEKDSFAERLGHKAKLSFDHKQYLKAIVLLWEAILVAGCKKYNLGNPDTREARENSEKKLYSKLKNGNRETLKKIEWLRNAVAHSSKTKDADVQRALNYESSFQELFYKGWDLFQTLMENK